MDDTLVFRDVNAAVEYIFSNNVKLDARGASSGGGNFNE